MSETKSGAAATLSREEKQKNYAEIAGIFEEALRSAIKKVHKVYPGASKQTLNYAVTTAMGRIHNQATQEVIRVSQRIEDRKRGKNKKPVRAYVDGCFDIMHSGHYNALRQAKMLCDVLVVGVHSDEEIKRNKGPPVMNDEERLAMVRACKWADEVVFDTPYSPTIALLDKLKCDFCVHGDDMPTNTDGTNTYGAMKAAGRMRVVKRTAGVSTTDLVGRLLLMTKLHHVRSVAGTPVNAPITKDSVVISNSPTLVSSNAYLAGQVPPDMDALALDGDGDDLDMEPPALSDDRVPSEDLVKVTPQPSPTSQSRPTSKSATTQTAEDDEAKSNSSSGSNNSNSNSNSNSSKHYAAGVGTKFLPTTWRISQFSNHRTPKPTDKVVYIDGAFDLFHVGHVQTLQRAKECGDFLYVGVHSDDVINQHKGKNYPIMNLHERVLNVLSCKYVDEVVIGAPWHVTKDLINVLGIHVVASGSNTKLRVDPRVVDVPIDEMPDPHAVPKEMGIYTELETSSSMSTETVVKRIIDNRLAFEKRNASRSKKELDYIKQRSYVAEV